MKKHFTEMSNDDYFVTKCCKRRDFLRSINDKIHVYCQKCMKVTGVKLVKFWKEEFEDEICFDWETFEFKNHKTRVFVKDGNYFQEVEALKCFLAKWLNLNDNYDDYGKQNNKVKIKARKNKIVIERIK